VALAGIDHRLNRESHAGFEDMAGARATVVQDLRLFVKFPADPMATKFTDHGIALRFGMTLDCMADITQGYTGFGHVDPETQAVIGSSGQSLGQNRRFADKEDLAGVTVVPILDDRDVDIDHVAGFESFLVRNTVADDMIDGGTDGLRETMVIQRGRDSLLLVHDEVVAQLVQLGGGNTGLDV